jgi:hypothetical protein
MKVTSDDIIKSGERELIDGITADLDWAAVERIFKEAHGLPLGEDVSYRRGDLVVHEDRIAYLLEFEVKVPLSMLLDRQGNCLGIQAGSEADSGEREAGDREADRDREPVDEAAGDDVGEPGSDRSPSRTREDPDGDPIERRMHEVREALAGMGEADGD